MMIMNKMMLIKLIVIKIQNVEQVDNDQDSTYLQS